MEKLNLLSLGNQKNRSYFIIKKNKSLRGFLAYLLLKCGFEDNLYLTEYEIKKKDVSLFEDTQSNYVNEYFDIDILYSRRAVILIVRTKDEKYRKFINSLIKEYCIRNDKD